MIFDLGNNNQRKATNEHFKYVPLNTENFDEQINQFTKFFIVIFEEKYKRAINQNAYGDEIGNKYNRLY